MLANCPRLLAKPSSKTKTRRQHRSRRVCSHVTALHSVVAVNLPFWAQRERVEAEGSRRHDCYPRRVTDGICHFGHSGCVGEHAGRDETRMAATDAQVMSRHLMGYCSIPISGKKRGVVLSMCRFAVLLSAPSCRFLISP